jgi:hypothetical protein
MKSEQSTTPIWLSLVFLFFLLGSLVTWLRGFPFEPWLREAFIGTEALLKTYYADLGSLEHDVWIELEAGAEVAEGVTLLDAARAASGLTLVTAGEAAYLVDLDGSVRHSWRLPYEALPASDDKIQGSVTQSRLYWQRAHVLPDGDLIVVVNATKSSPDGLAIVRLDSESRLEWVRHGYFHHDFDIGPDGSIYVLDQAVRARPPANLQELTGPLLDEGVVVLSPEGTVLRRISILDAFGRSPYAEMLKRTVTRNEVHWGDYLHSNNAEVADAATAAAFDFLEPGQILLSLREVDTIAVLDPETENITWAARGSWRRQHDPDFLANGNILIFDNQGDWDRGGRSRVIEYDPHSEAIVWQYPEGDGGELWSSYRAEQQLLANGNILINEFTQRRLFEVTRAGEIVWDYRCPFRSGGEGGLLCRAMSSRRYNERQFAFRFNGGAPTQTASSRGSQSYD